MARLRGDKTAQLHQTGNNRPAGFAGGDPSAGRLVGILLVLIGLGRLFEPRSNELLNVADLFLDILQGYAGFGSFGRTFPREGLGLLLDSGWRGLAMDFFANPPAQELDRVFTHTAVSLAAMPIGNHKRRHLRKDACCHSSRLGFARQAELVRGPQS
ncbi:hypothetical protein NKJ36_30205 [Mesorhizobium sp. M0142]|uniref:hypothetical protein n=1 Tax=unclassified Mesorhizobium TaxID=325217 RepID=UPI00333CB4C5